jgi:predicted RNA binding protein YcfA (HicA-like mRNA interferase family)
MVKVRDVIAAIEDVGWVYDHTTGDHRIFVRPGQRGTVVVPGHPGKDVPEGTLTNICRQAGIDKATLKRGGR